jgi:hypothetical protein
MCVQETAPEVEYDPAPQGVHSAFPSISLYVSAGQAVHALPMGYSPAGHVSVQNTEPMAE